MELVLSETNDRQFNWKVLLENYSENYHTPFVHPEIDTSSNEDYPMISDGVVLYAWDRPLRPSGSRVDEIRATLLPGEPGWEELASIPMDGPYGIGGYLTVWPNLMMNVFPGAFLAMWMEPVDARTTRVERRLFIRHELDDPTRSRSSRRTNGFTIKTSTSAIACSDLTMPASTPMVCWQPSRSEASTSSTNANLASQVSRLLNRVGPLTDEEIAEGKHEWTDVKRRLASTLDTSPELRSTTDVDDHRSDDRSDLI